MDCGRHPHLPKICAQSDLSPSESVSKSLPYIRMSLSYDTNLYIFIHKRFIKNQQPPHTWLYAHWMSVCLSNVAADEYIGLSAAVLNVWSRGRSSCRSMSSAAWLWHSVAAQEDAPGDISTVISELMTSSKTSDIPNAPKKQNTKQ